MEILLISTGLLFAAEGLLYAAAPGMMKRFGEMLTKMPEDRLRMSGLFAASFGAVIIFLVSKFMK